MNMRRSNIEIIGDILRLGRTGKTDIMYGCDLSYYQLQKYLHFLTERGFLELDIRGNRKRYRPTVTGEQLLDHIDKVRMLMGFVERDAAPDTDDEFNGAIPKPRGLAEVFT